MQNWKFHFSKPCLHLLFTDYSLFETTLGHKCMNTIVLATEWAGIYCCTCNSDSQVQWFTVAFLRYIQPVLWLVITLFPLFSCGSSEARLLRYLGSSSRYPRRLSVLMESGFAVLLWRTVEIQPWTVSSTCITNCTPERLTLREFSSALTEFSTISLLMLSGFCTCRIGINKDSSS
ncbi:Alpha-L-rhamnosidase rgxB [Trichinella pseudospiralis]